MTHFKLVEKILYDTKTHYHHVFNAFKTQKLYCMKRGFEELRTAEGEMGQGVLKITVCMDVTLCFLLV